VGSRSAAQREDNGRNAHSAASDAAPFADFIGRSVERSLIIYLNAVRPDEERRGGSGYIPLREAATLCDYSQEYLSFLARTGKLDAVKFGRNWMTSREAIEAYMKSVRQPRGG
jgi:hypothetical protein